MFRFSRVEQALAATVLMLVALAVFGPHVAQPLHHHDFADQRAWAQIPNALDVLSNLPFALWGVLGLTCMAWRRLSLVPAYGVVQNSLAAIFFAGLIATTGASAWYHLQPVDSTLAIDRFGMVVAFAGLLGLAGADRVSARAGVLLAACVMLLGPLSVAWWSATGDVLPWLLVQFGGLLLIAAAACLPARPGAMDIRWAWVVAIYLVAKVLELLDTAMFDLSNQLISGHSLKHVVASFAAWPVIFSLLQRGKAGENRLNHHSTERSRAA